MKLIIASHNPGKIAEFQTLIKELPVTMEVLTLADYPDLAEVEETGETFEANARLKAETIAQVTGHLALADDSGLVLPALNGEPGVYSARYAGEGASDADNLAKLLHAVDERVEEEGNPQAYFQTVLALSGPGRETLTVAGRVDGEILDQARGSSGFGYDPVFFLPELGQTFAEVDPETKNAHSHRGRAIQALREEIMAWLEGGEV